MKKLSPADKRNHLISQERYRMCASLIKQKLGSHDVVPHIIYENKQIDHIIVTEDGSKGNPMAHLKFINDITDIVRACDKSVIVFYDEIHRDVPSVTGPVLHYDIY